MEDILQPFLVILIGGLFAPLLTQLIEKFITHAPVEGPAAEELTAAQKAERRRKRLKLFAYAVCVQLLLFTMFFLCSKWVYFDKNYFATDERELVRTGIKKKKDYIIPKMTIKVYSENNEGVPLNDTTCGKSLINHCSLISISYEIVALRDFNSTKIFSEYYEALYARRVVKEPGSETEGEDKDPNDTYCGYDVKTTMKKFERKTITTRADYLYETLPAERKFFKDGFKGNAWDMFYYPNKEDDVIGEVEFQIISRSLKFNPPAITDAILEKEDGEHTEYNPQLTIGTGTCLNYNIITAKVPRLKNNETFGIRWSWK